MARLEVYGIDELDEAFRRLGNVPEEVTAAACTAGAKVAAEKIRQKGEAKGIRSDKPKHVLDSIKVGKFKKTDSGGYVDVRFSGTQKSSQGAQRVRNDLIAFENEYGNSRQEARPFVRPAMAEGEKEIVAPMADVISDWMENAWEA